MIDRLLALLETRKATIVALVFATFLYLADSTAAHLTNDFGIPADWSLRIVSFAKFATTIMAAVGLTPVQRKTNDQQ